MVIGKMIKKMEREFIKITKRELNSEANGKMEYVFQVDVFIIIIKKYLVDLKTVVL